VAVDLYISSGWLSGRQCKYNGPYRAPGFALPPATTIDSVFCRAVEEMEHKMATLIFFRIKLYRSQPLWGMHNTHRCRLALRPQGDFAWTRVSTALVSIRQRYSDSKTISPTQMTSRLVCGIVCRFSSPLAKYSHEAGDMNGVRCPTRNQ